ncbi:MAG: hypothetical protein HGA45_21050 [Chloroflexales bacterium]|nr:hypothetical protein [Chloroflexales bacterium]
MEHKIAGEAFYEIRIEGHLGPEWAGWFEELTITRAPDGTTLLAGMVADQAALHGHLARIRDLAMPLLTVAYQRARGP